MLVRDRRLNRAVHLKRGFVSVDFAVFVCLDKMEIFLFREQVYRD